MMQEHEARAGRDGCNGRPTNRCEESGREEMRGRTASKQATVIGGVSHVGGTPGLEEDLDNVAGPAADVSVCHITLPVIVDVAGQGQEFEALWANHSTMRDRYNAECRVRQPTSVADPRSCSHTALASTFACDLMWSSLISRRCGIDMQSQRKEMWVPRWQVTKLKHDQRGKQWR